MNDSDRPRRLVARAMTHFLVTSARAWARPHQGDTTAAFVFCTILSANLDHLGYAGELAALASAGADNGGARRRPISVHAVAQSLSLPYETVRRKVVRLADAGLVERDGSGAVVPPAALRRADIGLAMREVRSLLDELLSILGSIGFDLRQMAMLAAADRPAAPAPDALVARIVMDTQVRSLERIAPIFGDVVRAYLFCAVLRANLFNCLTDVELAWRYASLETLPPDQVREPITVRELARQVEMPFETCRRQVNRLVSLGALEMVGPAGVIAPVSVVTGPDADYQNAKLSAEFARMLAALARAGVFDRVEPGGGDTAHAARTG